jgi:hypothetical protein
MGGEMQKAKVRLTPEDVAEMIGLPVGHKVVAMQVNVDPWSLTVVAEGSSFPEVPPDSEALMAQKRIRSVIAVDWANVEMPF